MTQRTQLHHHVIEAKKPQEFEEKLDQAVERGAQFLPETYMVYVRGAAGPIYTCIVIINKDDV